MVERGTGPAKGGKDAINRRVGRDANRKLVEKHFTIEVTDTQLSWSRKPDSISQEALLDGIYVVRTSLAAERREASAAVAAYKSLARIERAFRSIKTTQLRVRPVYVYGEEHVRGHVFLCLLAYYVEWHLRRKLAPLLFEDAEREAGAARRETRWRRPRFLWQPRPRPPASGRPADCQCRAVDPAGSSGLADAERGHPARG